MKMPHQEELKPFKNWIQIKFYDLDNTVISDEVKVIHCDTRDFHILFDDGKPKFYKKPQCGFEEKINKGLRKLYKSLNNEKYLIDKNDILRFIDRICQKTGGYEIDWRYLHAENVENCANWDIKYIRFVRSDKIHDKFVVCNNYLFPIDYKEMEKNIKKL